MIPKKSVFISRKPRWLRLRGYLNSTAEKGRAGVPEVDVTFWRGGAVPAVSVTGVPEVDITHVNGAAQTATLDTIKAETVLIVADTNELQVDDTPGDLAR